MNEMSKHFVHFAQIGYYDPLMAGSIDGRGTVPHDRAIIRAYQHRPDPGGEPSARIFVGRLSDSDNEAMIREAFELHFCVKSVHLIRDLITNKSKRYAFVELDRISDAERLGKCSRLRRNIAAAYNPRWVIERAFGGWLKGWIPRKYGGGIGGRKESGQLRFGGNARLFRKPIQSKFNKYM